MSIDGSIPERSIDVSSMDNLFQKVKKDFRIPIIAQAITYNTPSGSFCVRVNVTDRKQYQVVLLTAEEFGKYQAACGHKHEYILVSPTVDMANFCKSSMNIRFSDDFNDDELKRKITQMMLEHNAACSPGVTTLPPLSRLYYGMIDEHGRPQPFQHLQI